ncbi:uncharacterized protein [Pseudorasbora parva]|uniref:uncharacterized protein isoform X2 n=1 Tax=Pseudorasbora parva TaxID=51549 RepID=UPI00351E83DD
MNLLYILLLVLWSAFNSSDAWYYTEPPQTTPQPSQKGASSNPCWDWYKTPCYWATTEPSNISIPHYQIQTQAPYWRRPYYQMPTQAPYWRRPYYQMTTQAPSWRRRYYWMPTQAPYWRRPYYQMTTQAPYWRRPYYQMTTSYRLIQDAPVPNITLLRPNQDREHVVVVCSFGRRFTESSFQLSVEGEHNYTLKNPLCYSNEMCVFDVKVSTPVSFTCVHEINSVVSRHSETYTYSSSGKTYDFPAVLNQHENGISSFYIGFFSFIVVCLFSMTAAVIMASLKTMSNAKGSKITVAANEYLEV